MRIATKITLLKDLPGNPAGTVRYVGRRNRHTNGDWDYIYFVRPAFGYRRRKNIVFFKEEVLGMPDWFKVEKPAKDIQ